MTDKMPSNFRTVDICSLELYPNAYIRYKSKVTNLVKSKIIKTNQ